MNQTARELQPARRHARIAKILGIRRELASGTYDIDGRLDSVLEKVLTDIGSRATHTKGVPPVRPAVHRGSVTGQADGGGPLAPARNASRRLSRRAG